MIGHLYQSSFYIFFFCLLIGSPSIYFPPENLTKEKAKAYNSNEPEIPAEHQPNLYTALKGNNFIKIRSFISIFSMM